ncbi:MAG: DUF5689 domain-containing protein, partial [Candidatus Cloacimonetes bacterium]|nr:DUF5689 domain-containing protein [Candidatus Cloacimonadota bacterium]MDY0230832.1 DUF5689 domain-containing protein [Candidatus Cloacimonadaceae bacterium]
MKKLIFLFTLMSILAITGLYADYITPIRTDVAGFSDWTDTDVAGTTYLQLLKATSSTVSPAMNFDNYTAETLNFKARSYGGANLVENEVTVSISVNNGSDWNVLGTRTPATNKLVAMTQFDLSSYSGTQVKIKFSVAGTDDDKGAGIDDIAIQGTPSTPMPLLTVSPETLTGFSYEEGSGPSAVQSFSISGANLDGNVSITAPTYYEISFSSGSGFTTSLGINHVAGAVEATTVYVQMIAGLSAGLYNDETIDITAGTAFSQSVTLSGTVTAPLPTTGYLVNFDGDGETKTGYASGTVNLSGLDWDMTVALIGTSSTDFFNGIRSARLQGKAGSSMTMLADKTGGLGTLSFQYRSYGTEAQVAWKAEYSSDAGSTWTQIGSSFTGTATIQTFSEVVNVDGNVRIKISLVADSGTANKRLNIDDILLSDYTGGSTPTASPSFNPPAGTYYTAQNVSISSATEGATVHYSTIGETGPWTEFTSAINVTATTTIWAYAEKDGMTDSAVSSATYTFPTTVTVSNIAELRTGDLGTVYELIGEAILTFQQSSRNQKYIQDATAAILIDDAAGNITTTYDLYDGITGIIGSLSSYNSLLQFLPVADPGIATSTANVIVPEVRTLNSLTSTDQAKLIRVQNVTIDNTNVNFGSSAENINVTQGETTLVLRTFPATDYSDQPIPAEPIDLICLVGQFNADMQVSPRFLADFASPFSYPDGTEIPTEVPGVSITITGGSGNIDTGATPSPVPNAANFTPTFHQVITLLGPGPWTVQIASSDQWVACLYSGVWHVVELSAPGVATFNIAAMGAKGGNIEIVSGAGEDPTLPVELSSFTVALNSNHNAEISWITQSETALRGFYLYRNSEENL